MFKNIFISLLLLLIGTFITNFYKNKSKNFEIKIIEKKKNILDLKKSNDIELKENVYLKSPENIKRLADRFLDKDYLFFEESNIEYLSLNEKK
jgi:hypothetical protein|tara:strand:+ start:261 stop:539 length:279 start_codon:yes stop_codon:yes gene_type:complete